MVAIGTKRNSSPKVAEFRYNGIEVRHHAGITGSRNHNKNLECIGKR
ncbi:hypothetical protein SAMN05421578_105185 [Paenibacillus macquariensis]|uniref:Uncharacterized protein n=1 Tax=Paenibacillus macquariensis TaxID=948756 RepID=A0ABY1JXP9_9BACL|nr:hypothetical protein SAMN05421578_105185 [Paenibacillus macquariensis]